MWTVESKTPLTLTRFPLSVNSLECGDRSPLFLRGGLAPRSFDRFNSTVVATGRDRPKRRQVGALQRDVAVQPYTCALMAGSSPLLAANAACAAARRATGTRNGEQLT